MALIIKDRVQETSTTSGTGTLTLAGAVTGYQSFASAIGNGNTTYYGIYETQTSNWEVGIGTVGSGTLARTTVLASSNAGSLVSFGGAQLAVWGDMPAAKGLYTDYVGTVSGLSIGGNAATATTTTNIAGGSYGSIPYQSTYSTTSLLPAGTSGQLLVTLGSYAAPAWTSIVNLSSVTTATLITSGLTGYLYGNGSSAVTASTTIPTSALSGTISNAQLVNSAITINGTSTSLGGSINVGTITSILGTTNQITASTSLGVTTLSLPSTVTTGAFVANETTTGSLSAGAFSYGTLGYSDVNILASFSSSVNTYNQMIIQNTNSGATASANLNVSNNLATSTTNFGEFGINSSGFTGSGFSTAGWTYLASASTDLAIGTYGSNAIHFIVNSGTTDALTIATTGNVTTPNLLTGAEVAASNGIFVNNKTIAASYSIPSGYAASSTGPVTISSGQTVTVPSGSRWVVL